MKTSMLMNQMQTQTTLLNAYNVARTYVQYNNIGQYIIGALKAAKSLCAGTKVSG